MKNNKRLLTIISYLGIIFSFLILDVGLRYLVWKKIAFVSVRSYSPLSFSLSYLLILFFIMSIFKNKTQLIYITTLILANIYFFAQMLHFKILGSFFSFVSIFSVGEATDYLGYVFQSITDDVIIVILLSILSLITVLNIQKSQKIVLFNNKLSKKTVLLLISALLFFRITAVYKLGKPVKELAWDAWQVPRNVYNNYSNNDRALLVSGLYEYVFRDIYLYSKKTLFTNNKKEINAINTYMQTIDNRQYENEYTNIFKDKNLIIIMLESIDNFLVTDEVMPTMYKLSTEGLNFTNRYAPVYGSGMTLNSEFAGITGLYSLTTDKAIYNYNKNNFDYSLPSLFKKNGYIVNSMHMNDGDFYNRKNFHLGLGFENHYPLSQMGFDDRYDYDTNIARNDNSYNLIVNNDKFVTFITTYSAHVPYIDNSICHNLSTNNKDLIIKDNQELSCLRILARETDNFINMLIKRLAEDGYLDNTVIALYADHYAYGYSKINEQKKQMIII